MDTRGGGGALTIHHARRPGSASATSRLVRRRLATLSALLLACLARPTDAGKASSLDDLADAIAGRAAERVTTLLPPAARADVLVTVRTGAGASLALAGALEDLAVVRLRRVRTGGEQVRSIDGARALAGAPEHGLRAQHDRIASGAGREPGAQDDPTATAAARVGFEIWIDLEVRVENGRAIVVGRVVELGAALWARPRRPEALAALFASAPLDAELMAWLGPAASVPNTPALATRPAGPSAPTTPPAAASSGRPPTPPTPTTPPAAASSERPPTPPTPTTPPAATPPLARRLAFHATRIPVELPAPPLAIAAANLDGDRAAELVVLTTEHVVVYRLGREGVAECARFLLGAAADVPRPRTPVGTLVVADLEGDGAPEIVARSSEHGETVHLGWRGGTLSALARAPGRVFPSGALVGPDGVPRLVSVSPVPGRHLFSGVEPALEVPATFLSLATASLGGVAVWGAVDGNGLLSLYRADRRGRWATLTDVGAGFALVDLDGDGQLDVAAGAHRPPGDADVFSVHAVADGGEARLLWRSELLPGGVVGVAHADVEGDGAPELLFLVRPPNRAAGELWLIR